MCWSILTFDWVVVDPFLGQIFHENIFCEIISMITMPDRTVEDESANMGKLYTKSRGFGSTRE